MTDASSHQPPSFQAKITDIERRLRALETAPRLTNASIQEGALKILDASGAVEATFGKQADGTYGISVLGPDGVTQRVGGVGYSYAAATLSYSATSWGTDAADQTVTVNVGPSGLALVTTAAFILPGSYAAGETAYIGVRVDGGASPGIVSIEAVVGANSGLGGTYSFTTVLSGLSDGAHTFQLAYTVSTAGVVATYSGRSLVVQPL